MSDDTFDQVDAPTLTIEGLLRMAVDDRLFYVNTSIPGVVVAFNAEKATADVRPSIMRRYAADEDPIPLPIIPDVPIVYPSSSKARIEFPLAVDDPVVLVFSQRSLEAWKLKGGVVDPADPRRFDLSDCYAFPGAEAPAKVTRTVPAAALRLSYGKSALTISDGKYLITGAENELLSVLIDVTTQVALVADTLGKTTTNTQLGPQALKDASTFTQAKADIDALKAKLAGLKG